MEDWKIQLKRVAGNMMNVAEGSGLYLNMPTGTILNVKNADKGGLMIEVPLPQSGLSKIFLINRSRENLALIVRLGGNDPIDRLMCTGKRAFDDLLALERSSTIIKEPDIRFKRPEKQTDAPFFIDKVNGF